MSAPSSMIITALDEEGFALVETRLDDTDFFDDVET